MHIRSAGCITDQARLLAQMLKEQWEKHGLVVTDLREDHEKNKLKMIVTNTAREKALFVPLAVIDMYQWGFDKDVKKEPPLKTSVNLHFDYESPHRALSEEFFIYSSLTETRPSALTLLEVSEGTSKTYIPEAIHTIEKLLHLGRA